MGYGRTLLGTGERCDHPLAGREPAGPRPSAAVVLRLCELPRDTESFAQAPTAELTTLTEWTAPPTARVVHTSRAVAALRLPTGHAAFVGTTRRTVGLLAVAALAAAVLALLRHAPLAAAIATLTAVLGLVWLFRTE